MKAIHNGKEILTENKNTVFNTSNIQNESNSQQAAVYSHFCPTVFNTSNIQNESNSQQGTEDGANKLNCVQYVKYTK